MYLDDNRRLQIHLFLTHNGDTLDDGHYVSYRVSSLDFRTVCYHNDQIDYYESEVTSPDGCSDSHYAFHNQFVQENCVMVIYKRCEDQLSLISDSATSLPTADGMFDMNGQFSYNSIFADFNKFHQNSSQLFCFDQVLEIQQTKCACAMQTCFPSSSIFSSEAKFDCADCPFKSKFSLTCPQRALAPQCFVCQNATSTASLYRKFFICNI
jgi:hypothetical protein